MRSLLRVKQYHDVIQEQKDELAELNRTLEDRVQQQLGELERMGRLRRFLSHEDEVPLTLLVWAQNFLLPQVHMAKENHLDNLTFLSTHAFIQTFSDMALGMQGRTATQYFLQS